ncbi:MAG: hypothetical protein CVV50_06245 [Spirochaetae bacterium HGW-Spirochaetae-6]|nr:MAG: hypothetical protein CVV50_06245 [Spirochaetae bacterium HGW-Spirochaetae-6]
MLSFYQDFVFPLFFKTEEENKLVSKVTLYVTKEVISYIENAEGEIKQVVHRYESPRAQLYEGKVTLDPHKIRQLIQDPLNYPQQNPEALETAIQIEQKDMISSAYEMVNNTMSGFSSSFQILINSVSMFLGGTFSGSSGSKSS